MGKSRNFFFTILIVFKMQKLVQFNIILKKLKINFKVLNACYTTSVINGFIFTQLLVYTNLIILLIMCLLGCLARKFFVWLLVIDSSKLLVFIINGSNFKIIIFFKITIKYRSLVFVNIYPNTPNTQIGIHYGMIFYCVNVLVYNVIFYMVDIHSNIILFGDHFLKRTVLRLTIKLYLFHLLCCKFDL